MNAYNLIVMLAVALKKNNNEQAMHGLLDTVQKTLDNIEKPSQLRPSQPRKPIGS